MFNLSKLRILAIGKVRKEWIKSGLNLYKKRLPKLSITEIKESNPAKESDVIRSLIKPNEFTVALCEEGENLTSLAFRASRFHYWRRQWSFPRN